MLHTGTYMHVHKYVKENYRQYTEARQGIQYSHGHRYNAHVYIVAMHRHNVCKGSHTRQNKGIKNKACIKRHIYKGGSARHMQACHTYARHAKRYNACMCANLSHGKYKEETKMCYSVVTHCCICRGRRASIPQGRTRRQGRMGIRVAKKRVGNTRGRKGATKKNQRLHARQPKADATRLEISALPPVKALRAASRRSAANASARHVASRPRGVLRQRL